MPDNSFAIAGYRALKSLLLRDCRLTVAADLMVLHFRAQQEHREYAIASWRQLNPTLETRVAGTKGETYLNYSCFDGS
jgi:hypothetical protein